MAVDHESACAVRDDILNDHVANLTGGQLPRLVPSTSLRRLMLKCSGSPSPHQSQSKRRVSIVSLDSTMSSTIPPSNTINAIPLLLLLGRRYRLLAHLLEILFHVSLQRHRNLVAADLGAALRVLRAALHILRVQLLAGGLDLDGGFAGDIG